MIRQTLIVVSMLAPFIASAGDYERGYAQAIVDTETRQNETIKVIAATATTLTLRSNAYVSAARSKALEDALTERQIIKVVKWRTPSCTVAQTVEQTQYAEPEEDTGILPEGALFAPLLADPRQPRFAAHLQAHQTPVANFNAALVELGAYFPFVRTDLSGGQVEFGAQAGIFSLFNLDSSSFNLINTDFVIGLPISYRLGAFSARAQVYHQSSHLGDEFLIGNPNVNRINLSYEDSELILAYEFLGFRLYGGGGYIFQAEPNLAPAHWQSGLEFRWPHVLGSLDVVAAGDFQGFEESNWDVDSAYTLGLAYRPDEDREIRLMLEYFNGLSPNGQFYNSRLTYTGVGLYFDL